MMIQRELFKKNIKLHVTKWDKGISMYMGMNETNERTKERMNERRWKERTKERTKKTKTITPAKNKKEEKATLHTHTHVCLNTRPQLFSIIQLFPPLRT